MVQRVGAHTKHVGTPRIWSLAPHGPPALLGVAPKYGTRRSSRELFNSVTCRLWARMGRLFPFVTIIGIYIKVTIRGDSQKIVRIFLYLHLFFDFGLHPAGIKGEPWLRFVSCDALGNMWGYNPGLLQACKSNWMSFSLMLIFFIFGGGERKIWVHLAVFWAYCWFWAQGTKWGVGDGAQINCVRGKCPTCCTIFLALLSLIFKFLVLGHIWPVLRAIFGSVLRNDP